MFIKPTSLTLEVASITHSSFYAKFLVWQCNKTADVYVWKHTSYKVSCIYFNLAVILNMQVDILKMEKSAMANEKFLTSNV